MLNQEEIDQQVDLLATYRRRLAHHLQQQAILGTAAPFSLAEDIRTARTEIMRIKGVLHGWNVTVEDHPDDDPPVSNPEAEALFYFNRGFAYAQQGDYNNAIANWNYAIQLQPENPLFYYNRGLAYRNKGDYTHAITDLDHAIGIQPDNAQAYLDRGNAYSFTGNYSRAIADYDQAIKLQPDNALAYSNRGNVYRNLGNNKRAFIDYDHAIELQKENPVPYYNRGFAYARN